MLSQEVKCLLVGQGPMSTPVSERTAWTIRALIDTVDLGQVNPSHLVEVEAKFKSGSLPSGLRHLLLRPLSAFSKMSALGSKAAYSFSILTSQSLIWH